MNYFGGVFLSFPSFVWTGLFVVASGPFSTSLCRVPFLPSLGMSAAVLFQVVSRTGGRLWGCFIAGRGGGKGAPS